MSNDVKNINIDKSMFEFVQDNGVIHDKKLDTKPIGYFKDALNRFKKNKSSVVSFIIIMILLVFALTGQLISPHSTTDQDGYYKLSLPKCEALSWTGWNGCKNLTKSQDGYDLLSGIGYEKLMPEANNVDTHPIIKEKDVITDPLGKKAYTLYVDSYFQVGFEYQNLNAYDYFKVQAYQDAKTIQVLYPMTNTHKSNTNADVWYKTVDYTKELFFQQRADESGVFSTQAARDENGNFVVNYIGTTNSAKAEYVSKMRLFNECNYDNDGNIISGNYDYVLYKANNATSLSKTVKDSGEDGYYQYAVVNQTGYKVRVMYYEYYKLNKTTITYKGKIGKEATDLFNADYNEAMAIEDLTVRNSSLKNLLSNFEVGDDGYYCTYLFGSNDKGKDIFAMLASGALLSFILAISVSLINLTIGAIYGAIEGYYGGVADLVMERVSEILSEVPFIVVATLFNLHLALKVGAFVSLLFAFVLTGWIGMAARTRMQFYRFKGQEYILSSRTLGAKDLRIMFKHIFPNAIGTLITGSVLSIPGVIFSESSLSYLHIIDLESSGFTSVGTLLSNGTAYTSTYPHVVLFPAIFISLLMISFNLLGNGLRDAFNPSLRGANE